MTDIILVKPKGFKCKGCEELELVLSNLKLNHRVKEEVIKPGEFYPRLLVNGVRVEFSWLKNTLILRGIDRKKCEELSGTVDEEHNTCWITR